MQITVKGEKRDVRPSIERFVYGLIQGAGWAIGFGVAMFVVMIFLAAAWNYAVR